jgi:hypothetical protein
MTLHRFTATFAALLLFAPILGPATATHAAAVAAAAPATPQQVLAFEKARWEATVANDTKKLADMLSDDLTYIHASGFTQNKKEYVNSVAAKELVYHSYALADFTAKIYGTTAVTHGKFSFAVTNKGQDLKGDAFYTGIYLDTGGGKWQLISWQTTRIVPQ